MLNVTGVQTWYFQVGNAIVFLSFFSFFLGLKIRSQLSTLNKSKITILQWILYSDSTAINTS